MPVAKDRKGRVEGALLTFAMAGYFVPQIWVASPAFAFAEFPRRLGPLLAGIVCFGAGRWLFYRSLTELGTNWSITLQVRERLRLITQGVYRFVLGRSNG